MVVTTSVTCSSMISRCSIGGFPRKCTELAPHAAGGVSPNLQLRLELLFLRANRSQTVIQIVAVSDLVREIGNLGLGKAAGVKGSATWKATGTSSDVWLVLPELPRKDSAGKSGYFLPTSTTRGFAGCAQTPLPCINPIMGVFPGVSHRRMAQVMRPTQMVSGQILIQAQRPARFLKSRHNFHGVVRSVRDDPRCVEEFSSCSRGVETHGCG